MPPSSGITSIPESSVRLFSFISLAHTPVIITFSGAGLGFNVLPARTQATGNFLLNTAFPPTPLSSLPVSSSCTVSVSLSPPLSKSSPPLAQAPLLLDHWIHMLALPPGGPLWIIAYLCLTIHIISLFIKIVYIVHSVWPALFQFNKARGCHHSDTI